METGTVVTDEKTTGDRAEREWVREGREMIDAEAAAIEESLLKTPDDFAAHVRLGSYYAFKVHSDDVAAAKLLEHAGWIVRNQPGSHAVRSLMPFMQGRGSMSSETIVRLWEEQVLAHPDDPEVLGNAAQALISNQERAVALLARCEELEPDNPEWPRRLQTGACRWTRAGNGGGTSLRRLSRLEHGRQADGADQAQGLRRGSW